MIAYLFLMHIGRATKGFLTEKISHKKAQKAQEFFLSSFVLFVPFCGWVLFAALLKELRDEAGPTCLMACPDA